MFTRARDASKVALMGLVDLLDDEYAEQRLLDTQWQTAHLATLGVVEIPRTTTSSVWRGRWTVPTPRRLRPMSVTRVCRSSRHSVSETPSRRSDD